MLCLVAEGAAMRVAEVAVLAMATTAFEVGLQVGRTNGRLESQNAQGERASVGRGPAARQRVIVATSPTAFGPTNAVGLSLSAAKSGLATAMAMDASDRQGLLRGTTSILCTQAGAATTSGRERRPSRHAKDCRSPVAVGPIEEGLSASLAITGLGPTTRRPRMAIVHAVGVRESP